MNLSEFPSKDVFRQWAHAHRDEPQQTEGYLCGSCVMARFLSDIFGEPIVCGWTKYYREADRDQQNRQTGSMPQWARKIVSFVTHNGTSSARKDTIGMLPPELLD